VKFVASEHRLLVSVTSIDHFHPTKHFDLGLKSMQEDPYSTVVRIINRMIDVRLYPDETYRENRKVTYYHIERVLQMVKQVIELKI
jgi:hypothetical protein